MMMVMMMMVMMMMVMMHYTERKNGNSHQHPLDAMMMNRLLLVNELFFVSAANPFFSAKEPFCRRALLSASAEILFSLLDELKAFLQC